MNKLLSVKEAQHLAERVVDMVHKSQKQSRRSRWSGLASVAWCAIFGGFHLYWALGGTDGFAEFSMPSNKLFALTRDPLNIGVTWCVVILCLFAAIAALAPILPWSRHMPRWILLTPLWIVCGLFLVRGFGNLIQTALIISGVIHFDLLTGPEAQAWYRWLLLDSILFSPWYILGGFAFGSTAWFARRLGDDIIGRDMVDLRQGRLLYWENTICEPCCC